MSDKMAELRRTVAKCRSITAVRIVIVSLGLCACSRLDETIERQRASALLSSQLFQDPTISNGYRAEWRNGTAYTFDTLLKKGDCTAYRNVSPFALSIIPSGTDIGKYWEWETGVHKNFCIDDPANSFEFHAYSDGWSSGNHTLLAVNNGILNVTVTGPDPSIHSPFLNVSGSIDQFINLRLRNATNDSSLQVFWVTDEQPTWTAAQSASLFIDTNMADGNPDTAFKNYHIDLSTHPLWVGKTIRQIRIDPVTTATAGRVDFEYVRLATSYVPELYTHMVEVNPVVVANDGNRLLVNKLNSSAQVMYSMDSIKSMNKITIYHNTKNEFRNVAINNGNQFATDTWPHLLLMQNFRQEIDMAAYERISVSMGVKLTNVTRLDNWLDGVPRAAPNAMLQTYFFLRTKKYPTIGAFFGLVLYDSTAQNYNEYLAVEQNGQAFYRIGINNTGHGNGQPLAPNVLQTIRFDLKALVARALGYAHANGKVLGLGPDGYALSPDDFTLSFFNIGWEDVGHWETQFELSDLSMQGQTGIGYAQSWDFANGVQAWNNGPHDLAVSLSNGRLVLGILNNSTDPFTHSAWPLAIDANANKLIRINLANNATVGAQPATARLFWTTQADPLWTPNKSVRFLIHGNTSPGIEYMLNLAGNPFWNGTVTQLRLDPIDDGSATSGTLNSQYIRVSTER